MCVLCAKQSVTTCLCVRVCVRVCVRESMLACVCPSAYIHIHLYTSIYLQDISPYIYKIYRLKD